MESIIAVAPTDRGDIFRLKVSADLCVGPAGHVFLFGGAGLGGAIAAMEQCSGRKLICATAQYLSYARAGAFLDLGVSILAAGKQVTQAQVTARIGEDCQTAFKRDPRSASKRDPLLDRKSTRLNYSH